MNPRNYGEKYVRSSVKHAPVVGWWLQACSRTQMLHQGSICLLLPAISWYA